MKLRPQIQLRFRDQKQWDVCRLEAEESGISLNEWILNKIEGGVKNGDGRDGVHLRGSVTRGKGQGGAGEAVPRAHEQRGSQSESSAVDRGAKKDRGRERANEVTAVDLTGDRREHDPKTCRVYGCLKCKAAGKKF